MRSDTMKYWIVAVMLLIVVALALSATRKYNGSLIEDKYITGGSDSVTRYVLVTSDGSEYVVDEDSYHRFDIGDKAFIYKDEGGWHGR